MDLDYYTLILYMHPRRSITSSLNHTPTSLNLPPLPTMTNDLQRQLFGRASPEPDQNRSEGNTTTHAQHESSTNRSVRPSPPQSPSPACVWLFHCVSSGRAGSVVVQQNLHLPPSLAERLV